MFALSTVTVPPILSTSLCGIPVSCSSSFIYIFNPDFTILKLSCESILIAFEALFYSPAYYSYRTTKNTTSIFCPHFGTLLLHQRCITYNKQRNEYLGYYCSQPNLAPLTDRQTTVSTQPVAPVCRAHVLHGPTTLVYTTRVVFRRRQVSL